MDTKTLNKKDFTLNKVERKDGHEDYWFNTNREVDALERQVAKEPNGILHHSGFCPNCHKELFFHEEYCSCGTRLDWYGVD